MHGQNHIKKVCYSFHLYALLLVLLLHRDTKLNEIFFFSPGATTPIGGCILQPSSGLLPPRLRGFLITHNDAPQSVGILWTNDQSVAETSTWQHTTLTTQTSMPWVGSEPTISAGERPKTYALDRAATMRYYYYYYYYYSLPTFAGRHIVIFSHRIWYWITF